MKPIASLVLAAAVLLPASAQAQVVAHAATPATVVRSAPALDDATIVAIFDAANTWDMESGALAAARGRSADVRAFGAMMVRDHRAVRQLGRDLAKKLHVTPTPPGREFQMAKDHASAMRKLRALHGAAFDAAYAAHEAAYHQAVIDAVTTQLLPATQNAELRDLETKVAPNFQAHLVAARQLQQKLLASR